MKETSESLKIGDFLLVRASKENFEEAKVSKRPASQAS